MFIFSLSFYIIDTSWKSATFNRLAHELDHILGKGFIFTIDSFININDYYIMIEMKILVLDCVEEHVRDLFQVSFDCRFNSKFQIWIYIQFLI